MPAMLSPATRISTLAADIDEIWLACMTVTLDGHEPQRLVHDTVPLERAVGTFHPYPFEVPLPADEARAPEGLEVRCGDVSRDVSRLLRDYLGVPKVTIEFVLASRPDVVERGPYTFDLKKVTGTHPVLTLHLGRAESVGTSQVPAQRITPSNSPGYWP